MSKLNTEYPSRFLTPLGIRKNGRPIFMIAGGSVDHPEVIPPAPVAPSTVAPPVAGDRRYFTEEDITKARQDEKDKLYKEIEALRGQLAPLQSQVEQVSAAEAARQEAETARQQAEAESVRLKEEAELSAKDLIARKDQEWQERIAATQTDWEARMVAMQQERDNERALLEKDRELANLQAYTQRRVSEEQQYIAPELLEFVGGNSQDDVEQSIERVKTKSAELAESARRAFAEQRSQQRGVSPTGYAPVGPLEVEGGTKQYTAEDIRNMDMQEYAKFRQQLPGVAGAQRNQGLYG